MLPTNSAPLEITLKHILRAGLFVCIHILVCTAIYLLFVVPINNSLEIQREEIALKQKHLGRLLTVVTQQPMIEKYTLSIKEHLQLDAFIPGENEGLYSANLQNHLKHSLANAGATLKSIRAITSNAPGDTRLIGARIEFSGTIASIKSSLSAIENQRPVLIVTSGLIRPSPIPPGIVIEPQLDAQIDIYGIPQGKPL